MKKFFVQILILIPFVLSAEEIRDSSIAECYFYFDVFASDECKELYNNNRNEGIVGLMSEPEVFSRCINSNCGTYVAGNDSGVESTYIYKMETLKECVFLEEREIDGDKLASTTWFKPDASSSTGDASVVDGESIEKLIPFKIIQYQCPSYKETICTKSERVAQSPVLCLKSSSTDLALAQKFQDCYVNHNQDACKEVAHEPGGPANYIDWRYCDEDRDNDGFNESLSAESQILCNRSDAATLECKKNSSCSVIAKCVGEDTIASEVSSFGECKNVNRNFTTHVVNTECGNMTDIYRENESCVRISNATESREEANERTYSFKSNSGEFLNDYQEYIIYRKQEDFKHETIFGALFFPNAEKRVKKGWALFGFDLSKLFSALGGKNTKSATVIDNHIPEAVEKGYTILSNDDEKGKSFKTKKKRRSFGRIKTYFYIQRAWWNSSLVSNLSIDEYLWDGLTPKSQKYSFDITTQPQDLLVTYNINTRGNYAGAPSILLNQYNGISSCSDAPIAPSMSFKTFVPGEPKRSLIEQEITRMGVIFPYTGTYEFEFYDDDKIVYQTSKFFKKDDTGGDYPKYQVNFFSDDPNVANNIISGSADAEKNGIANAVAAKMNNAVVKNKIDILTDNIITGIGRKNNDYFLHKSPWSEKEIADYAEVDGLRELFKKIEVENALDLVFNSDTVNLSESACFNNIPISNSGADEGIHGDIGDFNDYRLALLQCVNTIDVNGSAFKENNIDIKVNAALDDIVQKRQNRVELMTEKIYQDYQDVRDNIDRYFNKQATVNISTSVADFLVSFKSACGDYSEGKNDAILNFKTNVDSFTKTHYSVEIADIRDILIEELERHYEDVTIVYEYHKVFRTGSEKWDLRHDSEDGLYSCVYTAQDCDDHDNNASTPDTCLDVNRTSSGSCTTFGLAGDYSKCRGQCNDYHVAYWGSGYDDERGNADDVRNDQDTGCDGNYTFYETDDYFSSYYSSRSHKFITGTSAVDLRSAGAYSCDNFTVNPTGTSTSKCSANETPLSKHDLIVSEAYHNTNGESLQWTSTAKALSKDENEMKSILDSIMKVGFYKDMVNLSDAFSGKDNVRVVLATLLDNPVHIDGDDHIKLLVKETVTNIFKDLFTKEYTNEAQFSIQGSDIEQYISDEISSVYSEHNPDTFSPFNRIKIKDANGMKEHPYSMNFDITLPGSIYVKQAQNFNFVVAPHKEIRKYNCYTTWPECDLSANQNCTLYEKKITMHVADSDHKWVPVTRDESYECKSVEEVQSCSKWEYSKKCVDISYGDFIADYDDNDFTDAFYKGVGEAIAINESISLFGGQELSCESGLFTDFSWLTDPVFWVGAVAGINLNQFQGGTDTPDGISALAGDTVSTSVCSRKWAECMNVSGFSLTDIAASMIDFNGDDTDQGCNKNLNWGGMTPKDAAETCDRNIQTTAAGCEDYCYTCGLDAYNEPFIEAMQAQISSSGSSSGGGSSSGVTTGGIASVASSLLNMMESSAMPVVGAVLNTLVFDTFDSCNQCKDSECAQAHDPKEAVELLKLTNAVDPNGLVRGIEYGLGPNFDAYNMCFVKSSRKCAKRIFGKCIRRRGTFCCYNGKIPRMLTGQIYQQMGWTFESDGCKKVSLDTLGEVDFKPCAANNPIPSPANKCINFNEMKDYILNQTNWDLEKTVDLSNEVQAILDALDKLE